MDSELWVQFEVGERAKREYGSAYSLLLWGHVIRMDGRNDQHGREGIEKYESSLIFDIISIVIRSLVPNQRHWNQQRLKGERMTPKPSIYVYLVIVSA
ncbi:hypothetical protein [Alicyclobacillus suci]|uniref:hypothetical protein n=1 Tax=Alicyclobacillus suci TaxID=2816080 RepID=UPI001A8F6862|nr:hypothetical protein [Alicyclobacillus suci]